MNVALLHYWLLGMRGGEKVLERLGGLFPSAPIYTHACDRSQLSDALLSHAIHESFIAKLPGARRSCQKYLPLMMAAARRLDLGAYDLIISSESGPIKGIRKPKRARHVCYCHTPMRYLWDLADDYYRRAGLAGKLAMKVFTPYLRKADLKSAESVDLFVANSKFVQERIRRIYGRESTVVYPPVDVERFAPLAGTVEKSYYLSVGALVPYKNVDAVVEAFRGLDERLVVAGTGPMEESLRKSAPANVEFLGRVSDDELPRLYAGAKALMFPGIEDFGIVPVEAQAAGTPVLALRGGGALETVVDGVTGCFYNEATSTAIRDAIDRASGIAWDAEALLGNARRFSATRFDAEMMAVLHGMGIETTDLTNGRI